MLTRSHLVPNAYQRRNKAVRRCNTHAAPTKHLNNTPASRFPAPPAGLTKRRLERYNAAQPRLKSCRAAAVSQASDPRRERKKKETGLADNDADNSPATQDNAPADHAAALLRRVTALVAEHNLAELTIEEDGLTISVRGLVPETSANVGVMLHPHALPASQIPAYSQSPVLTPTAPAPAPAASAPPLPASGAVRIAQESPMMGVYYRSPSPEDPPFVSVGDRIKIGQPIGLIEAMKVYSELPSEVAGRIVEIAAQNGKLVQQGQPILFVEPV